MKRIQSENGRATFHCVPEQARYHSENASERRDLIRNRVGRILRIRCDFENGSVFLPNPAKHTDKVRVADPNNPEKWGWNAVLSESEITYYDRNGDDLDTHVDSVIIASQDRLETPVGIFIAPGDCAIVGFTHRDPEIDFLALTHSGWRGTAKDILWKTVAQIKSLLGNECVKDLEAFVSPLAKGCCYEFGFLTYLEAFVAGKVPEIDGSVTSVPPIWRKRGAPAMFALERREEKNFLDTPMVISKSLTDAGIRKELIQDLSICTVCEGHMEGYFSSRIDRELRFWVFLSLSSR